MTTLEAQLAGIADRRTRELARVAAEWAVHSSSVGVWDLDALDERLARSGLQGEKINLNFSGPIVVEGLAKVNINGTLHNFLPGGTGGARRLIRARRA